MEIKTYLKNDLIKNQMARICQRYDSAVSSQKTRPYQQTKASKNKKPLNLSGFLFYNRAIFLAKKTLKIDIFLSATIMNNFNYGRQYQKKLKS